MVCWMFAFEGQCSNLSVQVDVSCYSLDRESGMSTDIYRLEEGTSVLFAVVFPFPHPVHTCPHHWLVVFFLCSASYVIEGEICYMALCEKSFSRRLAFSYLEELKQQFAERYAGRIHSITRPYAFIEFGEMLIVCVTPFCDISVVVVDDFITVCCKLSRLIRNMSTSFIVCAPLSLWWCALSCRLNRLPIPLLKMNVLHLSHSSLPPNSSFLCFMLSYPVLRAFLLLFQLFCHPRLMLNRQDS